MEDLEIVELYWNRDENAINETQNKYGNYCYSIAYNILLNNEDAQESVNDTYLAAWNSMPPHHPLILSTYLGKITRRLSLTKWRDKNALKRGGGQVTLSFNELEECIASDKTIKDELDNKLIANTINTFLSQLKDEQRKVFVCRYFYFDSIEDISKRFNFSQSKVKMMLRRSREKLKDCLIKEGITI